MKAWQVHLVEEWETWGKACLPLLGAEEVPTRIVTPPSVAEALCRAFKLRFPGPDNISISAEGSLNVKGPSR